MPGKAMPLRLGPFSGGLSTYSDASTIGDNDCSYLTNFDLDINGSLVSRPPITPSAQNITGGGYDQRILGTYITAASVSFIMIASTDTLGTTNYLVAYNIAADTYTVVTSGTTVKFTAMVKYLNKAWFICDPGAAYTGNGGSWDGTTYTANAAMAKGVTACIYKERIFVGSGKDSANPSRVTFSGAADTIATWTGTDFFDVNNGDGQPIVKIYKYSSSIAVFKTNSTYSYAYDTSPAKGQVQSVASTIGMDNGDCLTEYENIIYIMHDTKMFSITNWVWELINIRVPFTYTNTHVGFSTRNASVSMLGTRVICRYFDTLYIYGTKTKAFSIWIPNTAIVPDFWVRSPIKDVVGGTDSFYAGNYLTNTSIANPNYIFKFKDTYTAIATEVMTCEFHSKIYDMISYGQRARVYNVKVPYTYKRLMWWGIDVLAKTTINASALPSSYNAVVPVIVDDASTISNVAGLRTFIRYIKSLRFRQIQFTVKSVVDGSTTTGPFMIFGLVAFISNKETVDKKVN